MATAGRGSKLAGKSRTDKRPPIELNLRLRIENAVRDSSRMPTAALASAVVNITQTYILKVYLNEADAKYAFFPHDTIPFRILSLSPLSIFWISFTWRQLAECISTCTLIKYHCERFELFIHTPSSTLSGRVFRRGQ